MNILDKNITEIRPYAKNAKEHTKKQISQVANSISRFGFVQPIVIDKNGEIVIGHCRYEAAKTLGLDKVPCVSVDGLTDKEISALRLADNKLNESSWDMNLVIDDLKGLDLDLLDLTGFDKDLLIEPDEKDDIVPENVPSKSKLGDLYELGQHRVLCGDCTDESVVNRLTKGIECDISFTSPPYNVGHNLGYEGKDSKYIHSDDKVDYQDLIVKSTQNSLEYAKDVFVNLQFLANNKKQLLLWLAELADNFKDIFFWKKSQVAPMFAENTANAQTEVIVLFGKGNNSKSFGNKKFRGNFSNSIETKSASGENKNARIHNATFPVELPLTFLKHAYQEKSNVLDLFAGTGTTMIACEKLGMNCYMVDIEPAYVDICVQRYVDYTGIEEVKLNGEVIQWKKTTKQQ
jgi:site-specific DNA-methyltransferase (adenine-specific)